MSVETYSELLKRSQQIGQHRCVKRLCEICGNPFWARLQRIVNGMGKFCGRKCNAINLKVVFASRVEKRFWNYIKKTESCWIWIGPVCKGYGVFVASGTKYPAHRFSYELVNGPMPKSLFACHNCPGGDNPLCVNPAHIWPGTSGDNTRDAFAKGVMPIGEKCSYAKLTDRAVIDIRSYIATERQKGFLVEDCAECMAKKYKVTVPCINRVYYRQTWKHI